MNLQLLATATMLVVSGCAQSGPPISAKQPLPECQIIYDAGSGGTDIFVYVAGELKHEKENGPALAEDGKVNSSDTLEDDIVGFVYKIDGFSWKRDCSKVGFVKLYATAGMRRAEQDDPNASQDLWKNLIKKLQQEYPNASIDARTITGFEEGLFDWLTIHADEKRTDFGVAAMGGASAQVAFPCSGCPTAQKIYVGNQIIEFYSRSFLGLGGRQLPGSLRPRVPDACEWGVGEKIPGWQPQNCASQLSQYLKPTITDPHNKAATASTVAIVSQNSGHLKDWFLTGNSFRFLDTNDNNRTDIQNCCEIKGNGRGVEPELCYDNDKSCFLAVFKHQYLSVLGIDPSSKSVKKTATNWTKGAVICAMTDCLRDADLDKYCRWQPASNCLSVDASASQAQVSYDDDRGLSCTRQSNWNDAGKWNKKTITFSFENTKSPIAKVQFRDAVRRAVSTWEQVLPLKIVEVENTMDHDVVITWNHFDGTKDWFDFTSGSPAFAAGPSLCEILKFCCPPIPLVFNAAEQLLGGNANISWAVLDSSKASVEAFDVESVALHEFGHVIGLQHCGFTGVGECLSDDEIMQGGIERGTVRRELTRTDISRVRALYSN